jgi:hypothetical protein
VARGSGSSGGGALGGSLSVFAMAINSVIGSEIIFSTRSNAA